MKRVLIATGWCLAISSVWVSTAALAADRFAQRFALELESGAAYYSVTLPAAVYAASQRSDLGDVRVFNGAGEPVPYSLDTPRESARAPATLRPVHWFPLPPAASGGAGAPLGVTIAADGSLRATAAPPARAEHNADLIDVGREARGEARGEARVEARVEALVIHVRDDNYQGRVSVEASDDLRNWQPAGEAQLLKVSYNGSTLSQDRIELNGMRARYLRLHWLDGAPYVESIDAQLRAAGAGSEQRADTQRAWREGIVAHAGPKAGEYFFETGGPYPVDRLRLNLPQPNTVAPAAVYSRTGLETAWREVSSATLFRLHNGTVEQSNPLLELMPDTDRQWRVVVDTRNGGLGSGTLTVAAGWRPATLTFVARGAAPFTLAVGSAAAVSSAVSRADLLMGASSVAAAARLGEELPAGQEADAQWSKDPDAMRRYMLWAALLLAVGSLGAIAWRLARGAQVQAQAGGVAGGMTGGGSGADGVGGADGAASGVPGESGAANAKVKDAGTADADGQSTGKN
ncbi:DUF3999 domain-containing protein [Paraburkholderia caffeinilytica]|uniref:Membrane protein n=1 Tax=Paraburkholderia caffeinilytica TaxID=1761016 RepID=A0ABQ1LSM1_9BURK|nr:DUF3999 domain-containing protein [Paraburkholderia caffeinilytica]GGC27651.1 membrane protein [Paraburkholderia caffeinilytica]CAB3780436.1 hypothetical protein LMG28690_00949 [Paraburkholderia caffeinilytica]